MTIVRSFVILIFLSMEGKEVCVEEKEASMEEGTCMEENRSLS